MTITSPGVYIQETPVASHAIVGAPTSVTAFLGRAPLGPVARPVTCNSLAEVYQQFGPDWTGAPMGQSLSDFFVNGGATAVVTRLCAEGATTAALSLGDLPLVAANPGAWGNGLTATVTTVAADGAFTLEVGLALGGHSRTEVFTDLRIDAAAASDRVDHVLAANSGLLRVALDGQGNPLLPAAPPAPGTTGTGSGGLDSPPLSAQDLIDGLSTLDQAAAFNLMVIPPDQAGQDVPPTVWQTAAALCQARRAFLIVDPPAAWTTAQVAADQLTATPLLTEDLGRNAAIYFPAVLHGTPYPPSGAVAGVYAATDNQTGVWKAPAGAQATLSGIDGLALTLTDAENGLINGNGINALRSFRNLGPVIWGARTLAGADRMADDFKYVPVRRLFLYIEDSILAGCQWTVFEPNGPALWAELRLHISTFLQTLVNQGALFNADVTCDSSTTTQADIDQGIVNVMIMGAPIQPAEFIAIRLQLTTAAAS